MKIREVLREVIRIRRYDYANLAKKLGYKGVSSVSNIVNNKGPMKTDALLKMLGVLDCELVVRSKTKDKTEWVIKSDPHE